MVRKSKYIPIIFTIISLFLLLLLNTTPVHATEGQGVGDYNGNSGSVNGGQQVNFTHAWSDKFKGYRISVVSESNRFVAETFDIWFGEGKTKEVQNIINDYRSKGYTNCVYDLKCRASGFRADPYGTPAEQFLNDTGTNEMPAPWHDFAGNGDALKSWIYSTEEGQEYQNGLRIIEELWGEEAIEQYINGEDEYFIIVEGISLFSVLDPDNNEVGVFAGTIYNWADVCEQVNQPYGNVWLRRGTNGTFGVALKLSETWEEDKASFGKLNMSVPPDSIKVGGNASPETNWLPVSHIRAFGYDVHQYTFSSVMNLSTHTWDYAFDTPAPAPEVEDIKRNKINIIKVYCTKDKETEEVISWDGSFLRKENPKTIQIEDEPEYIVEEWKTTKDKNPSLPATWDPVEPRPHIQKGTSQGTVTLDPDKPTFEQTLYVLLVKYEEVDNEKDLILHESEISRYYELKNVKEFKGVDRRIQWTMNQISLGPCLYRGVHGSHDGTDSEGNHVSVPCNCFCLCRNVVITESHLTFKVKNVLENSYSHILATKGAKFKPEVFPKQIDREHTGTGQTTYIAPWNYKFVVWRGQDELTLSNYKLSSDKMSWLNASINTLVNRMNSKPQGTRWTQRETTVPINFKLEQDNTGDYQISARLSCGHDGDHTYETTVNNNIVANSEVLIETYSGSPSYTVSNSMASPQSSMTGVTRGNGVPVPNDAVFSFYPYIRMTYEEMGSTAKKDANVLSQHKRSFSFSDYAEIGWSSSFPNLAVTSQQWSVHQISTNKWGKNRVLPGGALHSIQTANGGTTLTLRTWQVVADGNGTTYARLQEAGSTGLENATKAKAKQEHQKFLQTCVQVWNNGYGLELGVNKNDGASDVFTGDYIIGTRGGGGFNGMLSSEEKYYFNNTEDSVGNIQSGLFQASAGGTSEQMYCISSDTQGNIYLDGSVILKKDQGVDKLSNALAKQIDARTKVISNFVSAIERNTGEDYTASWAEGEDDGKWYNEAFEVYVLVQTSKVTVTLSNPSRRETTMDTNLIPKNSGKSDYFSSGYSFQYRNTSGSITQGDIKGNSGEFRETGVSLATIDRVFRSKVFILPNVNVQDIKD